MFFLYSFVLLISRTLLGNILDNPLFNNVLPCLSTRIGITVITIKGLVHIIRLTSTFYFALYHYDIKVPVGVSMTLTSRNHNNFYFVPL